MEINKIRQRVKDAFGIETLNEMQNVVAGRVPSDLILIAPTGSGKTLAFVIAMLREADRKHPSENIPRGLVIAPSRELVMQITNVLRAVCATDYRVMALYGGNSFSAEQNSLKAMTPDFIVATPGRLLDHLGRNDLEISGVPNLVIDEYDKTLELGFRDELRRIVRRIGRLRRVTLTSATQLASLPDFIDLSKAETIDISAKARVTVMDVPSAERDKLDTLAALLRSVCARERAIVFVNHRDAAERVVGMLRRRDIDAVLYHGGLEQMQREQAIAAFSADAAPVLVATDLAARGLDIDHVGAVVHYHLPSSVETYTHRNGRTARAGASGEAYVITGPDEDVPEFIVTSHAYHPDMSSREPVRARMTMLYINAGKREKISRGDIAGFAMKQGGVPREALGRITVGLSYSLLAVAPEYAVSVINAARDNRLKNKRVRITTLPE